MRQHCSHLPQLSPTLEAGAIVPDATAVLRPGRRRPRQPPYTASYRGVRATRAPSRKKARCSCSWLGCCCPRDPGQAPTDFLPMGVGLAHRAGQRRARPGPSRARASDQDVLRCNLSCLYSDFSYLENISTFWVVHFRIVLENTEGRC
jgi:hypothetical protein